MRSPHRFSTALTVASLDSPAASPPPGVLSFRIRYLARSSACDYDLRGSLAELIGRVSKEVIGKVYLNLSISELAS
jgi:hypothetical protein